MDRDLTVSQLLMSALSQRTKLPLSLVLLIMSGFVPLAGAAYVAKNDIATLQIQSSKMETRIGSHDEHQSELNADVKAIQESIKYQQEMLREIRQDLKELKKGK